MIAQTTPRRSPTAPAAATNPAWFDDRNQVPWALRAALLGGVERERRHEPEAEDRAAVRRGERDALEP